MSAPTKSFPFRELGEILTFQRGYDITKAEQQPGTIPIVSSSGINSYHNLAKITGPGIIIGRKGTLGTVHYVKEDYWPHDTTLWVKEFTDSIPEFLRYFLTTLKLENFDTGASNPTLNRNHIHKLRVQVPPLPIQRKIAAVLTSYDDLIETNRRRIALLERLAEQIYREWFVRLRFPGHTTTPIHKGVPEGWKAGELSDIASMIFGQSPPSKYYNAIGDGLPFHQGVGSYGHRFPHHDTYCSISGRKAVAGSILFSVRAPVGRLNITDEDVILGRGLAAMNARDGNQSYLFQLLKSYFSREDLIGNGAIFASVTKRELERFPIFIPTDKLVSNYNQIAKPIDEKIFTLHRQNTHLTRTRDLLLNRLISGTLRLDDLPIYFPPSMQDLE